MKKMITKTNGKEYEHILLDRRTDNCPLCDEPLKDFIGSWNLFHGEVSSRCCGAPYQTKDYYVDPEKSEGYDEYFKELNKPHYLGFSVSNEWVEPIRKAFAETGIKDVRDKSVMELAEKYKGTADGDSNE